MYNLCNYEFVTPLLLDNKGVIIGQFNISLLLKEDLKKQIIKIFNNRLLNKQINKVQSYKQKYRRLVNNFKRFLFAQVVQGKNVYFATFTFDNEHLEFARESFRKYLQRTCRLNFALYCDYGSMNERFHLHGIISSDYEVTNDMCNKFGFVKFTKLNFGRRSIKRSLRYIIDYSILTSAKFKILKSSTYNKKVNDLGTILDYHALIF